MTYQQIDDDFAAGKLDAVFAKWIKETQDK